MAFLKKHWRWFFIGAIVVLIVALFPYLSKLNMQDIIDMASSSIPYAITIILIIYSVKSLVMVIPVIALYFATGFFLSPLWAILFTYVCLALEMSLGYLWGRLLGGDKAIEILRKNKTAQKILDMHYGSTHTTCFMARMIPFPIDPVSMFFGASKTNFPTYLVFSLLGITPNMIPYVFAGNAILTPLSVEFLLPFGISIAISVAMFFIIKKIGVKKEENQNN